MNTFTPPRTVLEIEEAYPGLLHSYCALILLKLQEGHLESNDQIDETHAAITLHFSSPSPRTGQTFLERFTLAKCSQTPETYWKSWIRRGIANWAINRYKSCDRKVNEGAGTVVIRNESEDENTPVPPKTIHVGDLPVVEESPESILLGIEQEQLMEEFNKDFSIYLKKFGCPMTLAVYLTIQTSGSHKTREIAEILRIPESDVQQCIQNLRYLHAFSAGLDSLDIEPVENIVGIVSDSEIQQCIQNLRYMNVEESLNLKSVEIAGCQKEIPSPA